MTVFESDDELDRHRRGLAFPRDEHLGVDLLLPDFAYLRDREDEIRAVMLTHGARGPRRRAAVPAAGGGRPARSGRRG